MDKLSKLPNIGKKLEEQLNRIGICSFEELKNTGSKDAWLKIKAFDPSACINRLYALEGAVENIKKTELSEEKKEELKAFYRMNK
ncbi:MAG: TfoX/Sxy family protein [Lachnospiraceae bacterium]|nr:TfoX/Sxy family protein [Lachnospiraceae bacterium]